MLDVAEHTDPNTQKTIKHYLVKWRSLQYEESTWELEEDVDPIKIQQFEKIRKLPPKDKWKVSHFHLLTAFLYFCPAKLGWSTRTNPKFYHYYFKDFISRIHLCQLIIDCLYTFI